MVSPAKMAISQDAPPGALFWLMAALSGFACLIYPMLGNGVALTAFKAVWTLLMVFPAAFPSEDSAVRISRYRERVFPRHRHRHHRWRSPESRGFHAGREGHRQRAYA